MALGNIDLNPQLIQAVRDAVNVVDVASEHTRLTQAGKRYKGLCPLHKEKTPSFSVDPAQGLFYCFGCGTGGDAIKLHMLLSGDDFPGAIETLARRYGVPLPRKAAGRSGRDRGPDVAAALDAAQRFFRHQLEQHVVPREYLAGRKIPAELVERFGLGYAPDGWEILLGALSREIPLDTLIAAGLVGRSQKSGKPYDRFRHRLTFPIRNASGRLVGFGGRTLGDDRAKYVNTAETESFHKGSLLYGLDLAKRAIREEGRAVLVEGYFDVLGVAAAGVETAVAGMGTALTREQAKLLSRYAREVVIGYDGDDAGERAYRRALPLLIEEGLAVYRASFGAGHDPDSLRLEAGPAAVAQALAAAEDGVRGEIERLTPPQAATDPQRQSRAAGTVAALLSPIPDPVLRFGYARVAAQRLRLPVDLLARKLGLGSGRTEPAGASGEQQTDAGEMRILALLLSGEAEVPPPSALPPPEAFLHPGCRNIYRTFRTLYGEESQVPPSARDVLARTGGDEATVDALARTMLREPVDSRNSGLGDLLEILWRRWRRQRQQELALEIEEAQRARDDVRLEELLKEKTALKRALHPLSS